MRNGEVTVHLKLAKKPWSLVTPHVQAVQEKSDRLILLLARQITQGGMAKGIRWGIVVAGIANPLRPLVRRRDGGQGHGSAASLGGDVGGERDRLTAVAGVDVVAKKSASFASR